MKHKLLLTCFGMLLMYNSIFSQYCGTSGPSVCNTGNMTVPGISDYNSFPCVKNTVPYNEVVQVLFPDSVNQFGFNTSILSMRIDSIVNLPCGLCWQCDNSALTYAAGAKACIRISGTANDGTGAYQVKMYGTATTSLGPLSGSLETLGFQFFLNVTEASDSCTPINILQLHNSCQDTTPGAGLCDMDIQLQSTTFAPNCQFDSAIVSVVHPTGPGYKVYWQIMDLINLTTTIDSVSSSITTKPGLIFYDVTISDSAGCVKGESIELSNAGPYKIAWFCYGTYDSTGNSNQFTLLYERNNWYGNIANYKVYHYAQANGPGDLLATMQASEEGYVVDTTPLTYSEATASGHNSYSLKTVTTCGDETSTEYRPVIFNVGSTVTGYPMLTWAKSNPVTYSATYIFSRHVGGSWRIRFSTTNENDNNWIDLAPDTSQMEYMLGFLQTESCDPSRSSSNMAFSSKGNVSVDPALVVPLSTSIKNVEELPGLTVYPNPASNVLTIQCNNANTDAGLNLKVYDITGRMVISRKVTSVISSLDVSELAEGVYTIAVASTGKAATTIRFIKN